MNQFISKLLNHWLIVGIFLVALIFILLRMTHMNFNFSADDSGIHAGVEGSK